MAISIDWSTSVITVPKADTTLIQSTPTEIRELNINTFRLALKDIEDNETGITYPTTHSHNTTVSIGGVTLARVVEILAPYTVTFENGTYAVNLVGANSNISDRTNVNSVSVRSANSAGLIQTTELSVVQALVEGLRPHHKALGDIYFWDPYAGDDDNSGADKSNAVLTFARAHALCQDWHHDVIMIVSTHPSTFSITETISITKNWLFLRGAGFDTRFQPTTVPASKAVIEINAEGVQLEGFHVDLIDCADVNSIGIKKTGKYFHMENVIVKRAAKQGFISINGHDEEIMDCMFAYNGTDGVEITNTGVGSEAEDITIKNCHFDENTGSGINITGANVHEVIVKGDTLLHGNLEYGFKVGSGSNQTHIFPDVLFRGNTLGEISNSGVSTMDSRYANKILTVGKFMALK